MNLLEAPEVTLTQSERARLSLCFRYLAESRQYAIDRRQAERDKKERKAAATRAKLEQSQGTPKAPPSDDEEHPPRVYRANRPSYGGLNINRLRPLTLPRHKPSE